MQQRITTEELTLNFNRDEATEASQERTCLSLPCLYAQAVDMLGQHAYIYL